MEKITGTVKWFSNKKGFGFLAPISDNSPTKEEIFVHHSSYVSFVLVIVSNGWMQRRVGEIFFIVVVVVFTNPYQSKDTNRTLALSIVLFLEKIISFPSILSSILSFCVSPFSSLYIYISHPSLLKCNGVTLGDIDE